MTDQNTPEQDTHMWDDLDANPPEGYRRLDWVQGFGGQMGPLFEMDDATGSQRAFRVMDHHVNGGGICHGGMLMAFADIAFGHVAALDAKGWFMTIRLVTDFVAPAELGEWVMGTGKIVGKDRSLYTVEGRIWSGDKTIMTGQGIFKTRPAPEGSHIAARLAAKENSAK
ncbi:MAG: PaaI family thioesterase [Alphaproteobacteria bacterium]